MSTGKRLAKRSIIGTRVCAQSADDGKYYSGVIHGVKTPPSSLGLGERNNNSINLTPSTRYSVRFDPRQGTVGRSTVEFHAVDLIGPGFRTVVGLELLPSQRVYVTFNGREVCGEVQSHSQDRDEVIISICPVGVDRPFEVQKKLDEVRLLESRKSARLADQDTDFARLADMAGDRKRNSSHTIDVPVPITGHGSRKRRPSNSQDDFYPTRDPQMDECSAALVLMSLSCSPHSTNLSGISWASTSPGSSSSASSRSTPSPPPRDSSSPCVPLSSSASDEGIGMDYFDELPRKKKSVTRIVFQCTWPSCSFSTNTCATIEAHVRNHLPLTGEIVEGEEEFYYTELEIGHTSPAPTLSHRDMARPPHEDPEYQRQVVGNYRQRLTGPISIPPPITSHHHHHLTHATSITSASHHHNYHHPQSPHKVLRLTPPGNNNNTTLLSLSSSPTVVHHSNSGVLTSVVGQLSTSSVGAPPLSPKTPVSPRRVRGENKKCRKVYGMEHREQWCTQCKWKKACSRFAE